MDILICKGEGCPIKETCKMYDPDPNSPNPWLAETPGKWIDKPDPDISKSRTWKCYLYWGAEQDAIMDVLKKATGE